MPGKPYDREFHVRRWQIVAEQQKRYDLEQTSHDRYRDTEMLFDFWFDRFRRIELSAGTDELNGWAAIRAKNG